MGHAKSLRQTQTDAELRLWRCLRNSQLGEKFRRQHRIAGYIADFVCVEKALVVELDGSQHFDRSEYDAQRSAVLEAHGFRVLRFWNNDVLARTDDVLSVVHEALKAPPHPSPLPRRRRGSRSENPSQPQIHSQGENQTQSRSQGQRLNIYSSEGTRDSIESPLPRSSSGGEGWVRGRFEALHARARLYALIRQFFAERNVLEVETPILSAVGNTDPNIESFTAQFSGHVDAGAPQRYLRTSSEFAQKRLLATDIGDCYELGRVFRNGEAGRWHNPEFTMIEWYRVGWDHRRLMDEVIELVQAALALVGRACAVEKTTYRALFIATLDIDPFSASDNELRSAMGDVQPKNEAGLSRDDWLDLLLTHRIQPGFPADRITAVRDYPASQCALAKIRNDDPPVAERFELYLGTQELANGYHELTDAREQRLRFEHDNARRRARSLGEVPLDENLLAALEHGLPDCAGVALGIERLLMAMLGSDDIRDVLAFPFARA